MGIINLFNKKKNEENKDTTNINNNEEKNTAENTKFRLIVQEVFGIKDRGCVITGKVENANIHMNDDIYIMRNNGSSVKSTVSGLQIGRTLVEQAEIGKIVGMLLKDIEPENIAEGDLIIKSSTSNTHNVEQLENIKKNEMDRLNGIVNEDRRVALGGIVFQNLIKKDMLENLTIQECSFILKSLNHFNEKSDLINYGSNKKIVYAEMLDKIKNAESIFVLCDKGTGCPFIGNGAAEVYSSGYWAEKAVQHYAESYRNLFVEEFKEDGSERIKCNLFIYLYLLGMDDIILDNGAYGFTFRRDEIFNIPDMSEVSAESIPVTNPIFRYNMNAYLDEARWGVNYENRDENVKIKEDNMLKTIREAKFLVPAKVNEETEKSGNVISLNSGTTTSFALITNNEQKEFVPLFTDWVEFEKVYNKDEWQAITVTVKDAIVLSKDYEGMVVNPFGENLIISNVLAGEIFKELM